MAKSQEIKKRYINSIDKHLDDIIDNKATEMFEIEDFAEIICIHPTHLSDTIKKTTGISACGLYQVKIMERALRLLKNRSLTIQDIALQLTYEPSQFTKWFKRITNLTPKHYRFRLSKPNGVNVNSEIMTILKNHVDIPLCF